MSTKQFGNTIYYDETLCIYFSPIKKLFLFLSYKF